MKVFLETQESREQMEFQDGCSMSTTVIIRENDTNGLFATDGNGKYTEIDKKEPLEAV